MTYATRQSVAGAGSAQGMTTFVLGMVAVAASTLIAVLPYETILAIALLLSGIYAGARRPDLGLALIALSVPIQRTLLVGFGDTAVTITKVVLWSTIGGWLCSVLLHRTRIRVDLVSWGAVAVTAALALSGWNAIDGGLWIGETYRWLAMIPVGLFAASSFRQGWSPLPFLVSSALGTAFCFAGAAWQVFAQLGPPSFESRGLMRATGPFGHPNQLAIYLELTVPLLLGLSLALWLSPPESHLATQARRLLPLWVVGTGLGLIGLMLSQSRGGSVGMLFGLGITIALASILVARHARLLMLAALAVTLMFVSSLMLYIGSGKVASSVRGDQVTSANFAVEERLAHWAAGVEMATRHPVLGVGAGNYDRNFREATTTWRFRIGRGHAHNSYLQMLAQAGVVGFAAYMALISSVAVTLADALRKSMASALNRGIVIGISGMSGALLAHAVFEYVHVLSLNLYMAIVWGLAAAIATGSPATQWPTRHSGSR
jgi:O-antigen ligase